MSDQNQNPYEWGPPSGGQQQPGQSGGQPGQPGSYGYPAGGQTGGYGQPGYPAGGQTGGYPTQPDYSGYPGQQPGYPAPAPGYGYPPAGGGYAPDPLAPYGYDPYGRPYSHKSKLAAGLLQLLLGGVGAGRWYTGHVGIAIAQLLTCGGLGIWALIDGILLLVREDSTDSQGRVLRS